ncbi:kelch repeat and BTB domain-containing protein 8-like isoform X4 [Branchiostoma lanceolatum]|uniref:kelch repeat and BTB domain-containing protein 8-like isoform X4 n=1 Tax=Branchiostoma lanceolatum TaxID=7740 RepID=UPI00345649D9
MPIHVWLMRSVVSSVKFFRFGTRIFMNMDVTNDEHTNEVLRGLNKLRKRAELTDVVLEVEGRCFPCHRAVLASCSPYFRTMFTSGYAEAKQERISIQDVSEVAMATILDYAYTGCLQMEPDQVQAVMSAARLLQIGFVSCNAAEYMKAHLDVSNCADVLMYADMQGDFSLVDASEKYIASRFNQVALQPSFLRVSLPHLKSLLDRDDLWTNSEDDVVQAALRWIDFNQEERLQHFPALCNLLRHSFISSKQQVEIESRSYAIDTPDNLDSFSLTATSGDELYLAGGDLTKRERWMSTKTYRQNKFYQYNPLLNTWEPKCEMIAQRIGCGLVYLKGYIYAIGGDDTKGAVERYDPSHDEWTSIPPIPQPMSLGLSVVTLDDSIYVISKEGCYFFSTTENK